MSFPSVVEAYEQQRVAKAKREGFALFTVGACDSEPGFIYTIGMKQHGLPDLLCFYSDDMGTQTCSMMTQVASSLIESAGRYGVIKTLRSVTRNPITVSDPDIRYTFELLRGDDYMRALKLYLTRSTRYRDEFGGLPSVLIMNHDDVPSFQRLTAEAMFVQ